MNPPSEMQGHPGESPQPDAAPEQAGMAVDQNAGDALPASTDWTALGHEPQAHGSPTATWSPTNSGRKDLPIEHYSSETELDQWPANDVLITAGLLVSRLWNRRFSHLGVTHTEVLALQDLAAQGPLLLVEMAALLQVHGTAIDNVLQKLEERGLIGCVGVDGDPREVLIRLTHRGTEILFRAKKVEAFFEESDAYLLSGMREELLAFLRGRTGTR